MTKTAQLNEIILRNVQDLSEKEKREVLNFIEYMRIKEESSFIEYVNERTRAAIEAKERGEKFISLEELQREHG
jgi:ribosomal protein L22